jgi:hypothetical protein
MAVDEQPSQPAGRSPAIPLVMRSKRPPLDVVNINEGVMPHALGAA